MMNGARQPVPAADGLRLRSLRARSVLVRHFGLQPQDAEHYLADSARREGRKRTDIEKAIIQIAQYLI